MYKIGIDRNPSQAAIGTMASANPRPISARMIKRNLRERSISTPVKSPKSVYGSASNAVRNPISTGVAFSNIAAVNGKARNVTCPPKCVIVSDNHSVRKSRLRQTLLKYLSHQWWRCCSSV